MKNHQLLTAFAEAPPMALVHIIDPNGHLRFSIGKITWLVGSSPVDTITEASRESGTLTADAFKTGIEENGDPTGDAQLFIRYGDEYAYYDIARVRSDKTGYQLIVGAFRTGGG